MDASILEMLQFALETEGYEVFPVPDHDQDFLALIEQVRPQVVMLDYILDGKASIEACRHIHEQYPHLPVIALSCNNNINEVYSNDGFDDYIPKPFDLELLYAVLRKHIPNR